MIAPASLSPLSPTLLFPLFPLYTNEFYFSPSLNFIKYFIKSFILFYYFPIFVCTYSPLIFIHCLKLTLMPSLIDLLYLLSAPILIISILFALQERTIESKSATSLKLLLIAIILQVIAIILQVIAIIIKFY